MVTGGACRARGRLQNRSNSASRRAAGRDSRIDELARCVLTRHRQRLSFRAMPGTIQASTGRLRWAWRDAAMRERVRSRSVRGGVRLIVGIGVVALGLATSAPAMAAPKPTPVTVKAIGV